METYQKIMAKYSIMALLVLFASPILAGWIFSKISVLSTFGNYLSSFISIFLFLWISDWITDKIWSNS